MNTIIEKIRAEVERRKKEMVDASFPPVIKKTRISELSIVLDILDDIQERTDNPITFTLKEQPVKIDIRKELASIEFMGVNDARDSETIARHFYELGRQSKPEVSEDFDLEADRFLRGLKLRTDTPPIPDEYIDEETFDKIARHFAQWQKEQMLKEAVEGEVVQDIQGVNRVKSFSKVPDWLHFGQKVKLIIIKED